MHLEVEKLKDACLEFTQIVLEVRQLEGHITMGLA
jgi:hypothetical protein